jgi:ERBB-3 binding protein
MQTAADIVHNATKKLVELAVEGAKIFDLCVEGDKLIEQGTGAVYNKGGKGSKISKGTLILLMTTILDLTCEFSCSRSCIPHLHFC